MEPDPISKAAQLIAKGKHIVALTGAGLSVDSGIPDFRSPGGLWERFEPMEYAHIEAFLENPKKVWNMLKELSAVIERATPNNGHIALAKLEKLGKLEAVITQNIDNLHQCAGSKQVIEYHGNANHLICLHCHKRFSKEEVLLKYSGEFPPRCECDTILKPDVVLFGEPIPLDAVMKSQQLVKACDIFLVLATSATVAPVNMLPTLAKTHGAYIVEVNLTRTILTSAFTDIFLQGSTSSVLPQLVSAVEARTKNLS